MTDAAWKAVGNAIDTMPGKLHSEKIAAIFYAIAALPLADRLAYARGLVDGDGFVVVRVPDELAYDFDKHHPFYSQGWNAYRAATLATEDRDE